MRQVSQGDEIFHNNAGQFCGIALGWDFCAEHEWGIKGLERAFGLSQQPKDFAGTVIRLVPDELQLIDTKNHTKTLLFMPYGGDRFPEVVDRYIPMWRDKDFTSAWSDDDFAIRVKKPLFGELQEIYEAFQRKDIAICFYKPDGNNPFSRASLTFLIASLLDPEIKDGIDAAGKR